MEKKHWKILGMGAVAALWLALSVMAWCRPADAFSATERRPLAAFPEITGESLLKGQFMSDFESYTLDQFPMRDGFRSLKAMVHYKVLGHRDNNGIYLQNGHIAKLEYPLNEQAVDHALKVFQDIYHRYLQDCRVFAAVVPDKSYYLARENGYPVMDYDALFAKVEQGMPYASYVNQIDLLSIDDYYRTDTHWRQERLTDVAKKLCSAMGAAQPENLSKVQAEQPFYGVYYGQAALPVEPDTLYTMESPMLAGCRVLNFETGQYGEIYDREKLTGEDPYEVFLSGSVSLLRIENPYAQTGKELIVFRDSFGSSLVPLLVQGYDTVTVIDIRYLSSALLSRFVDFGEQDVLFLYSTLVLNNGTTLN